MFNKIFHRLLLSGALITGALFFAQAQKNIPFCKAALKENRDTFYADITKAVVQYFSEPLNEENEGDWISAFGSVNLLKYETPFVNSKINFAANHSAGRSNDFKKAVLELLNSDYRGKYTAQVKTIFLSTDDPLLMAMAANYILTGKNPADTQLLQKQVLQKLKTNPGNAVLTELWHQLADKKIPTIPVELFFSTSYLPGQVLVFSFQRHNRDYPGLVVVRDTGGHFMKNSDGRFFAAGQLARSESNMPGYISMGNTPQGIFRMDGFDTSKNFFIGTSTNIQLTMPFEYKASHFYRDSTLNDSVWTEEQYAKLLPGSFKNDRALFGTYYAGKAGRTEIIAHGTTIDPAFYLHKPYYPYTPSAGCLVAKELWNDRMGYLQSSDQLLLAQAVQRAGGPKGYLIVIELNDDESPVKLGDIVLYMN